MSVYVTASGVFTYLPARCQLQVDTGAYMMKACFTVNDFSNHVWASGDYVAMRAAELYAASFIAETCGLKNLASELKSKGRTLINVLNLKPGWRTHH